MKILPKVKKYAGIFSKGFVISMVPEMTKGALIELLQSREINVEKAVEWVTHNKSLWKSFEPESQAMLKNVAGRVGNIDWLTAPWVIEAIKEEMPAVASLFLGWKKANNWLKRQVKIIKEEATKNEGETKD